MPDTTTEQPAAFPAGDRRSSCACGAFLLLYDDDVVVANRLPHAGRDDVVVANRLRHAGPACLDPDRVTFELGRQLDPLELFAQLGREVEAGRTLISLTVDDAGKRRAALDALQLAGAVLADAADLLTASTTDKAQR